MPKAHDFFGTKFTEEYLSAAILEELNDSLDKDIRTWLRDLAKYTLHERCMELSQPFLSLMNYLIEAQTDKPEHFCTELGRRYETFVSAHREFLEKNSSSTLLCEWVACAWCCVMGRLKEKAEKQKDDLMWWFLVDLHDDMTISFVRIYKRLVGADGNEVEDGLN